MLTSMPGKKTVAALVAMTIAYTLLACVGLHWAQINGAGSPIWPAAGFALAGLLIGGPDLWPAIVVGRLAAGFLTGSQQSLTVELVIALGNAFGAVCGVYLLKRNRFENTLYRMTDALRYMAFGAAVEPIVSGIVGTIALTVANHLTSEAALTLFIHWVVGGFVGALLVGPLVLSLATLKTDLQRQPFGWVEFALPIVAVAAVSWLLFIQPVSLQLRAWHVTPFLIWAALASRMPGAMSALAILSVFAVTGNTQNPSALGAGMLTPAEQLALMQQFIAVTAIPVILLAAVAEERRRQGDEILKLALDAAQQGTWHYDVATNLAVLDRQARALFGVDDTEDKVSVERMISLVHADDQPAVRAAMVQALSPSGDGTYAAEHRVATAHDKTLWLAVFGKTTFAGDGTRRIPVYATGVARNITARKIAEERQQLLMRELVHRGKNQLAIIQSIAARTLSGTISIDQGRATLLQRLQALAGTFSLLSNASFEGAPLHDIVNLEFEKFSERADADGPNILVNAEIAQNFALVVHELATNAVKYGALSSDAGRITVRWSVTGHAMEVFEFCWTERRGSPAQSVPPNNVTGFGSLLIGRLVPTQLSGNAVSRFNEHGFEYILTCPLSKVGRLVNVFSAGAGKPDAFTAAAKVS
jgi:PAS domain S-box-containing protein